MAIVNGEYGPYDTTTGRPVATSEAGMFYSDTGEPYSQMQGASQPDSSYVVRGDYRMPKGFAGSGASGALETRDASGNWVPVTAANAPAGYDPRQDSEAQGSNERLRFDHAFGSAPADVPITQMQDWAIANGWTEPDRSNNEGTFGSMLSAVVPGVLAVVGGVYAMGGFSAALTPAAEAAAIGSSSAETTAMSAWASAPAENGLMSSIGTNAAIGAGKAVVTGKDPLEGALLGAAGGAISGSGILGDVSGGLIDATGATGFAANAITKGVNAAATGAIGSLANGGSFSDMLEGGVINGLTSGVSNYAAGAILPDTNNTVAGATGGVVGGATQALLSGGDVGTGIMRSGLAGSAAGLATDLGAGPTTSGAVGSFAGGLVNSQVQQDPVITQPIPTAGSPGAQSSSTTHQDNGLLFSRVGPQFVTTPRTDMRWGTRLSGG